MKIINGLEEIPTFPKKTAIAIGNFDGVHLGHKRILETLIDEAKKNDLIPLVLTFSPHPKKVVGKEPIEMIQSLDQRLTSLSQLQVQAVLILHFDQKLANHTAQEFIQRLVLKPLNAEEIIVGENFCFGKNRQGCSETLHNLAMTNKFRAHIIPPVILDETTVSSSFIRNLLHVGQIEKANVLLGREYEIEGTVIKGQCRGKNLGFPTANIKTKNEILPEGVFLSNTVIDGAVYASLTNVGKCPTFDQEGKNVESYILNFEHDIYGQGINVRFLKKIREEKKFATPKDLANQIQKDLALAKKYFQLL
ncbi:bifunctional riboflavin kinase/FAD synthetase [Acidobacteriota bacterium]